jgi:hypothetical protein
MGGKILREIPKLHAVSDTFPRTYSPALWLTVSCGYPAACRRS